MSISASHRLGMGQLEGRNRTEGRNLKDASLGDAGFRLHPGLTSLPCIRRGCETLKQRRYSLNCLIVAGLMSTEEEMLCLKGWKRLNKSPEGEDLI